MKEIRVKQGQSITDLALQHYGHIEGVWLICEDNQLAIGSKINTGQTIKIDETKVINPRIAEQLKLKTIATQ